MVVYLLEDLCGEKPAELWLFHQRLDELDTLPFTELTDQVNAVPIVPTVLTELNHHVQEIFCSIWDTVICNGSAVHRLLFHFTANQCKLSEQL